MKAIKLSLIVGALLAVTAMGCSKSSDNHTVPESNTNGGVGPFDLQISDTSAERVNKFAIAINQEAGKVEFNYTPAANLRLQFQGATTVVNGCDASQVKVTHMWFLGASGTTLTKILQRNDTIDVAANTKYTLVVAYENLKGCTNISYEMRMKKVEAVVPAPPPAPVPPISAPACDKLKGRFNVNMTSITLQQTQCSKIAFNYVVYDFGGGAGEAWTQEFSTDGVERLLTINDGRTRVTGNVRAYYNPSSTPANRLEIEIRTLSAPNDVLRKEYYIAYPSAGMACLAYDSYLNGVPQKTNYHEACGNASN